MRGNASRRRPAGEGTPAPQRRHRRPTGRSRRHRALLHDGWRPNSLGEIPRREPARTLLNQYVENRPLSNGCRGAGLLIAAQS
jgi:hypothetical protein